MTVPERGAGSAKQAVLHEYHPQFSSTYIRLAIYCVCVCVYKRDRERERESARHDCVFMYKIEMLEYTAKFGVYGLALSFCTRKRRRVMLRVTSTEHLARAHGNAR